jgi:hypothetical protein
VLPASGATNQPIAPSLAWNKVATAAAYRLQISTAADFSAMVNDTSGLTDTVLALTGLLNNTRYYWCVCATNAAGTSSWSITANFTTIVALPATVSIRFPMDSTFIAADSVLLAWFKGTSLESKYFLEVATDSGMTHMVFSDSTLTDTTKLIKSLSDGVTYWWRIKAYNAAGWGPWGQKIRFIHKSAGVLPDRIAVRSFVASGSSRALRYALPEPCFVSVRYYDVRGRLVVSLVNSVQNPGYYTLSLPVNMARGAYIQVFRAGTFIKKNLVAAVR